MATPGAGLVAEAPEDLMPGEGAGVAAAASQGCGAGGSRDRARRGVAQSQVCHGHDEAGVQHAEQGDCEEAEGEEEAVVDVPARSNL